MDTRDVPAIPPGRPWGDREREKRWTGPLRRAHPQPPPPRFPNASRHPLGGVGSDNMIPAPVRSVPQTDRWCLRLLTIMQRGCDTSTPLWWRGRSLRGCCEWVGMPIVGRRRFLNTANQRLRTLAPILQGLEGHVLESGGAGTSDLGFVSVDEPRCPVQAFHPQGERRLSTLVDFTRPVVEHSARVSEESGLVSH